MKQFCFLSCTGPVFGVHLRMEEEVILKVHGLT